MTNSLSDEEFTELFAALTEKTKYSSITNVALKSSVGKRLIDLGDKTVQYMFRQNIPLNAHTMCLLFEITGENPVPNEDAGHIEHMANAWRKWAKEKGYL